MDRRLANYPVPDEIQRQWESDMRINARGVAVDMELIAGALELDTLARQQYMQEAQALSGLDNPNSVAQLTDWLQESTGCDIQDLRKDTVAGLLRSEIPKGGARRMLEIRQELGKTSNKKYQALAAAACTDNRVRGLLQFYGANRTGRWAGRIVQPQNLPRTYIAGELLPLARELVKRRQPDALRWVFGSIPDALSQLIRTAFTASRSRILVDADFSAIEARVLAWLAGEDWVLDVFRTHGRIYEATASQMFHIPLEKIRKGNPEYSYRQKGKVATLALGYQGGPSALVAMGALNNGVTEDELPDIVALWRQANPAIVQLWYALEAAAQEVVKTGRKIVLLDGRVMLARECDPGNNLDFLTVRLPSGRKLYYAQPHMGTNRFGRPSLCYYGANQATKQWEAVETYGGKLTENITQAVARDCLADAIDRLEAAGYPVVFHIHDEVVIDAPLDKPGTQSLQEVIHIMSQPPDWAIGLPLSADGWTNDFFKKD